jgi:hypothetical protein
METAIQDNLTLVSVDTKQISVGLQAFEQRKAELQQLVTEADGLEITSIEDKKTIAQVSTVRKKLKAARVEVEKEGKAMRDNLNRVNKVISSKEKELIEIIEPTEKKLLGQEKWVEEENERIRQEELRKEEERIQNRLDRMQVYGYNVDYNFLKVLSDEDFDKMVDSARVKYEAEQEQIKAEQEEADRLRRLEEERIQKEREELAELRKKQEEADRIIREKEEAQRLEQERIENEKRKVLAERKSNRIQQLRSIGFNYDGFDFVFGSITITQDQIDGVEGWESFVTDIAAKVTVIKEEQAKKRQAEIEQARKEAADKALREKQEADARALQEQEERIAQASDRVKWNSVMDQLRSIAIPEMKSAKNKKLRAAVRQSIEETMTMIENHVLQPQKVS